MKETFRNNVYSIREFVEKNERFPSKEHPDDLDQIPNFFNNANDTVNDIMYMRNIDYIANYKKEHGFFPSADYKDEKLGHIGGWMSRQRALHRMGELPKEREQALDHIGFEWEPMGGTFKEIWIKRFDEIKKIHEKTGEWPRCEDKRNYRWISHQSSQYKKGRLNRWQIEALKKGGLDIEHFGKTKRSDKKRLDEWLIQMDAIESYFHKTKKLPTEGELTLPNGNDAKIWLRGQLKKVESFSSLKKERIERIGFNLKYDRCFKDITFREYAVKYKNEYYHCTTDQLPDNMKRWRMNLLDSVRRGTLKPQRKKLLEDLGLIEVLYKK